MANLTTEQLDDLATAYSTLGKQLLKYKLANLATFSNEQLNKISNKIDQITDISSDLFALAVYNTLNDITPQLNAIKQASIDIKHVLTVISTVQKAIDIATKVVELGTSILSFNVEGIVNNAAALVGAIAAVTNGGIGGQ
jgi:hypothetical protein